MYKNNKLWNRYFPRSQRISYWYRETPWCPNIYFIDLNQFLLLFLLIITKQKYFSSSPRLFFFITLSLNLSRSLWFDLGTLRIILLWSPTLGSEQALQCFLYRFSNDPFLFSFFFLGPEGSLTLYSLFQLILAFHLLIMQDTTRVIVPSDALPRSFVSYGNQNNTVQGSSPHKCG